MAATIKVDDTINFTRPFVNWANLTIGTNSEPALTAANMTLQTLVGPPFVWPWNRATVSFLTTQGTQDYNTAIADFGYLESVTIQAAAVITSVTVTTNVAVFTAINNFALLANQGANSRVVISGCTTSALNGVQTITSATATTFTCSITTGNITEAESGAKALAGPIMPLEVKWGSVGEATEQDRPSFISTQTSDESGTTFKFRLLPIPDQTYQIIITYQQVPSLLTATSQTWGVPNQLQYLYTYFFLFLMLDYFEDQRAARYRQLAIAALLARQNGLSKTDRNLFLGNWLPLMKEEEGAGLDEQQGTQAKGI